MCRPIARHYKIKRRSTLDRFGEQGYALVYFAVMGMWGFVSILYILQLNLTLNFVACYDPAADILVSDGVFLHRSVALSFRCQPLTLFRTPDYPHWEMMPELKRYYLMHAAYWLQQFIVLLFRLEKPRKDYVELILHHIVTLWLIG